eukprot:TRINITY_DN1395_c0_g3_i1.p1 TRINITY_DN1395_c0_g3~~TRINITY_DN1395_c0_g3_i1.p1  ORF type:complete len:946 (-),score=84.42 TRINITY_DN1395_c0_g3_i1:96-2933(-)
MHPSSMGLCRRWAHRVSILSLHALIVITSATGTIEDTPQDHNIPGSRAGHHECSHWDHPHPDMREEPQQYAGYSHTPLHGVKGGGKGFLKALQADRASAAREMRVHVEYIDIQDAAFNTPAQRTAFYDTIAKVVQRFSSMLKVIPVEGNLKLKAGVTYCDITPPSNLVSPGVAADMILFVKATTKTGGSIGGIGGTCSYDQLGRPVTLRIILDATKLSEHLVAHELTHGLGMTTDAYTRFRDEYGRVRSRVTDIDDVQSGGIVRVVTPNAVFQARKFWGCDTMKGPELRQLAWLSRQKPGAHWEQHRFENEYMVSRSTADAKISPITLGLLQDSGWYYPDYSKADDYRWGRGAGCTFTDGTCDKWGEQYFCTQSGVGCTHDRKYLGVCEVIDHATSLPPVFQYFPPSTTRGGKDQERKYCPRYAAWVSCAAGVQSAHVIAGSVTGQDSYCIESSLAQGSATRPLEGVCYRSRCSNGVVQVAVGSDGAFIDCPTGTSITVNGYSGVLKCPRDTVICDAPYVAPAPPPPPPFDGPTPTPELISPLPPSPAKTECKVDRDIYVRFQLPETPGVGRNAPSELKYRIYHDNGGESTDFADYTEITGRFFEANKWTSVYLDKDKTYRFVATSYNGRKEESPPSPPSPGCMAPSVVATPVPGAPVTPSGLECRMVETPSAGAGFVMSLRLLPYPEGKEPPMGKSNPDAISYYIIYSNRRGSNVDDNDPATYGEEVRFYTLNSGSTARRNTSDWMPLKDYMVRNRYGHFYFTAVAVANSGTPSQRSPRSQSCFVPDPSGISPTPRTSVSVTPQPGDTSNSGETSSTFGQAPPGTQTTGTVGANDDHSDIFSEWWFYPALGVGLALILAAVIAGIIMQRKRKKRRKGLSTYAEPRVVEVGHTPVAASLAVTKTKKTPAKTKGNSKGKVTPSKARPGAKRGKTGAIRAKATLSKK